MTPLEYEESCEEQGLWADARGIKGYEDWERKVALKPEELVGILAYLKKRLAEAKTPERRTA